MTTARNGRAILATLLPGFSGPSLPGWLRSRLADGLGGVCLFGTNIKSPGQLQHLTTAIRTANPDAVIAIDEEGGDVTRLHAAVGSPDPGNAVLGRIDNVDLTRAAAARIGWRLREAGITVDFAPSVDINSRSDNPIIGVRSFGATPEHVARHAAGWTEGLQSTGVAATAKHFPGHGDTAADSHLTLPVVDRSAAALRERELVPFAAAVAAGARLVMTSHILLPQLDPTEPATMSPAVLTGLLRGELGFGGVVVSDALDMAGARRSGGMGETAAQALRAGCDLLCLGTDTTEATVTEVAQAVGAAVAAGALTAGRVEEAADRVRALATDLTALRASAPRPADVDLEGWPGSERALTAAFDVSPGAGTWRTRAADAYAVVRLDSTPNTAAGYVPWGPFAAVADEPDRPASAAFTASAPVVVTPGGPDPDLPAGVAVLVVGRDIHRHGFARAAVDRLRREHAPVLVVDMGWPSADRRYADLATFGSSRLVGRALLGWLSTGQ